MVDADQSGSELPAAYLAQFRAPAGYIDFARFGPVSSNVTETVAAAFHRLAATPDAVDALSPVVTRTRRLAAKLTGRAGEDHVVLVPNTSTGLFHLAFALPDDAAILVSPREFPANVYPWVQASRRGGPAVAWLEPPNGRVTPDIVKGALQGDIGALAVSAVDFRTGYRADLAGLRAVLGERLLIVDAIQGFGVADMPWHLADAVVTGGQKWLRAGWGSGFMSLSGRALDRLAGSLAGWSGVVSPGRFDGLLHEPDAGAGRFSMTNPDLCSVAALEAALCLFASVSPAAIERAVAQHVDMLMTVIAARGGRSLVPLMQHEQAGIISLVMPGHDPTKVGETLRASGLIVSVRDDHVRLSPHATTPDSVVDQLDEALRRLTQR